MRKQLDKFIHNYSYGRGGSGNEALKEYIPTLDEIDYLATRGFYWMGRASTYKGTTSDWLFKNGRDVYDLSSADIYQIDNIKRWRLFLVEKQEQ